MMCQGILRPQQLGFGQATRFIAFIPITMLGISLSWPDHQSSAFIPDFSVNDVLHKTLRSNSNRHGHGKAWWKHGASPMPPPRIPTGRLYNESVGKEQEDYISSTWPLSESASKSNADPNGERVAVKLPPVIGDIRPTTVDTLRVRPRSDEGGARAERDAPRGNFVELFRGSAPYIRAHRGAVMVVHIEGETVEGPGFMNLMDDLGLLTLLGLKLVIVTGSRPQIKLLLNQAGIEEKFVDDIRITSKEALKAIKAAAGFVRIEVESALTRGGRNGVSIHVSGGSFFSAQPVGVKKGVDYGCSGEVRKVDAEKIRSQLCEGSVVHLTCMGYSPSGEVFNVDTRDLASECAAALGASKLVFITDKAWLQDTVTDEEIKSLRLSEARSLLVRFRKAQEAPAEAGLESGVTELEKGFMKLIERAERALGKGVARAHVVPTTSGALLQELFTRDGAGLLISRDIYDGIRLANPRDIPGITEIIAPLEEKGTLVPRPREQLEAAILQNEFFVITRDEAILGVAFFKRYGANHAELGCLAIHHNYRKRGWGEAMLSYLERVAVASSVKHLFVLSTVTMQWFVERGFQEADVSALPPERRESYNWERMSKIYVKILGGTFRDVDAEELLWNVQGMA